MHNVSPSTNKYVHLLFVLREGMPNRSKKVGKEVQAMVECKIPLVVIDDKRLKGKTPFYSKKCKSLLKYLNTRKQKEGAEKANQVSANSVPFLQ